MKLKAKTLLAALLMICAFSIAGGGIVSYAADTGLSDPAASAGEAAEAVSEDATDSLDLPVLDLTWGFDPDDDTSDNAKASAMLEVWKDFYEYISANPDIYENAEQLPVYQFVSDGAGGYQAEWVAEYPVITEAEAWQLMLSGCYLNEDAAFTPEYEELSGLELSFESFTYMENGGTRLLMPYYSFIPSDGSVEYDACLVPAIDPAYLSGEAYHGSIVPRENVPDFSEFSGTAVSQRTSIFGGSEPESTSSVEESDTDSDTDSTDNAESDSSVTSSVIYFFVVMILCFAIGVLILTLGIRTVTGNEESKLPRLVRRKLRKVPEENRMRYLKRSGTGSIIAGIGLILMAADMPIFVLTFNFLMYVFCFVVFCIGLIIMVSAIKFKKRKENSPESE